MGFKTFITPLLFIQSRQKFSVPATKAEFGFANLSAVNVESIQVPHCK